jgi:hypothetical protein
MPKRKTAQARASMADYSPKTAGKQPYEHGDTFPHASRLEAELRSNLMLVQLHSDRTYTPPRRPGARVPALSGSRHLAAPAEHPYRQLHDVPDQAAEQCSRPPEMAANKGIIFRHA